MNKEILKSRAAKTKAIAFAFCLFTFAFLAGCRQDMHDQPKYRPLRPTEFFDDGRSSRPFVEGTVARGHLYEDDLLYRGRTDQSATPVAAGTTGQGFADVFPFEVTREVVDRGEGRYNIYCSVCHDKSGTGFGMIVRRGYRQPPSFHIDRLKAAPAGYFFDVITNGFGAMPDYSSQISARDRWAIVAYIRALQKTEQKIEDLSEADRERVKAAKEGQQKTEGHEK
ncbi:MAG: cytochrome c [Acidobacteriota bacterium]